MQKNELPLETFKVFPWILSRIGGDSYESINFLNSASGSLERAYLDYITLLKDLELSLAEVSVSLYNDVSNCNDALIADIIKKIRREIYVKRKFGGLLQNNVMGKLSSVSLAKIAHLNDLNKQIADLKTGLAQSYKDCLSDTRTRFQSLLSANEPLKKGLVLSSRDLLNRIDKFVLLTPGQYAKKDFQTELGLLKYLTRICCKTSPFSTFTNVSLSCISDVNELPISELEGSSTIIASSQVRLNNTLLKYLKALLSNYEDFYFHLKVNINPSLSLNVSQWKFLLNHNNVEAFQTLENSELIAYLVGYTRNRKSYPRFQKLVDLIKQVTDTSAAQASGFLKSLVDAGILEFNFEVSGTDPFWNLKLERKLTYFVSKDVKGASSLRAALKLLGDYGIEYEKANSSYRCILLEKAFLSFRAICKDLHMLAGLPEKELLSFEDQKIMQNTEGVDIRPGNNDSENSQKINLKFEKKETTFFAFRREQIFYEDSTIPAGFIFSERALAAGLANLNDLLKSTRIFSIHLPDKEEMAAYFKEKYGIEGRINLLQFYEDFYRDIKMNDNPNLLNVQDRSEEYRQERAAKKSIWNERLKDLIKDKVNNDQVGLDLSELLTIDPKMSVWSPYSYGAFIQPWFDESDQSVKFMVNNSFPGYGKMLSRFIYLFPDELINDLKKWNTAIAEKDTVQCEATDASYFNANIHPPILPHEINIPGGNNNYPPELLINCSNVLLTLEVNQKEIALTDATTQKVIRVYNLSFQNSDTRSKLFQLLERLSKLDYLYSTPIISLINNLISNSNENDRALIYPRITLNNRVVLQRKAWQIKTDFLPLQLSTTDEEYFIFLNNWRNALKIPDETFVFFQKESGSRSSNNSDHKPQYINFFNPLLVKLFSKSLKKDIRLIRIVEMLPKSKDMLKLQGRRFATEFVVQWYDYEH